VDQAESKRRIPGHVVKGDQRGRTLGFPTINVETGVSVPAGVYAGRVAIEGKTYAAAVHAGDVPTFGKERFVLEAYLLDFAQDAYGKDVEVELGRYLRPTRKFADGEALAQQIAKDIEEVRELERGETCSCG